MLTKIKHVHNVSFEWFIIPEDEPWEIFIHLYWPGHKTHDGCWFMLAGMTKQ